MILQCTKFEVEIAVIVLGPTGIYIAVVPGELFLLSEFATEQELAVDAT
jgi:hypothetical protein